MALKENTPARIANRRYEALHKERKENRKQYNTTLPKEDYEKINQFIKEHHLTKVDLIYKGYFCYLEEVKKQKVKK